MASHTHNAQVGRLEVVETGRRRRWSEEEKLRIVTESLIGPRLVSATARRHGISTSLLFTWRRAHRRGMLTSRPVDAWFVPAVVVADVRPPVADIDASIDDHTPPVRQHDLNTPRCRWHRRPNICHHHRRHEPGVNRPGREHAAPMRAAPSKQQRC